jgi:hypothetical protein
LGNSASYFYHGVRASGKREHVHLVPISGKFYIGGSFHARTSKTNLKVPSYEELETFSKVFIDPIVNKAMENGESRKIVIIDHSSSGEGVENFVEIVKLRCPDCRTVFLNLTTWEVRPDPDGFSFTKYPENVYVLGDVFLPHFVAYECLYNDCENVPRLTPNFPHEKWTEASTDMLEKFQKDNPIVAEAVFQIENKSAEVPVHY